MTLPRLGSLVIFALLVSFSPSSLRAEVWRSPLHSRVSVQVEKQLINPLLDAEQAALLPPSKVYYPEPRSLRPGMRPLEARDLTVPLTGAEVSCNEAQLRHLLSRAVAGPLDPTDPALTIFATYSDSFGNYEGLLIGNQFIRSIPGTQPPPSPESYLAFHLDQSVRTLLLNPARPTLGQVSLTREETASTLVAVPGFFGTLMLSLDPTLGGAPSSALLAINNYAAPASGAHYNGFSASSTKPGRGLSADGLLTPCHILLSPQDRKVFEILERIVRVMVFTGSGYLDAHAAIFRAEDSHTYRVESFEIGPDGSVKGLTTAELQIDWTATGMLTTGTLSLLPACTSGQKTECSAPSLPTTILLVPPVLGGSEKWSASDPRVRSITFDPTKGPGAPVSVDFGALLASSTWNG